MSAPLPAAPSHDPYAALRIENFLAYLSGSFLALIGRQAVLFAASLEIYQWTNSATALGLVGVVNVLPVLVFSLPAGALADRFDRRRIIAVAAVVTALLSVVLALLSQYHATVPNTAVLRRANGVLRHIALRFERHADPATLHYDAPALPLMFAVLLAIATVRILVWPARTSILPLLVPRAALGNGITWNASAFEITNVAGPALGGFVIAAGNFPAVYLLDAALGGVFWWLLRRVTYFQAPQRSSARRTWREVLAGAGFIWRQKAILGASSLDLFAVLLGGAVALLPVYADRILHVGAFGLGWLRAAPSIGAIGMAWFIAHRPPLARPGGAMLWAVAGFGAAIILFGWSQWFWLSFLALVLSGVCDNVSVVVRQSLVQMLTPDALRGRVTAVNQIFVGSSNELGALRAGLMAALFGPVAAVVWGGLGTIAVTAAVARLVPALGRLAPLPTLRPED